jgi:hypothetical protein
LGSGSGVDEGDGSGVDEGDGSGVGEGDGSGVGEGDGSGVGEGDGSGVGEGESIGPLVGDDDGAGFVGEKSENSPAVKTIGVTIRLLDDLSKTSVSLTYIEKANPVPGLRKFEGGVNDSWLVHLAVWEI